MDAQLQQLIELQMEQNQLLERYFWRFRFSLLSLLIRITLTFFGAVPEPPAGSLLIFVICGFTARRPDYRP
jgi:hypothetical protein